MTKEQEAQQAQTIAEIKERHISTQEGIELGTMRVGMPTAIFAHNDRTFLLEIVDSQAQKIEQQDADISNLLNKLANWNGTYERQELKIAEQRTELNVTKTMLNDMNEICAEQAKEIERLTWLRCGEIK